MFAGVPLLILTIIASLAEVSFLVVILRVVSLPIGVVADLLACDWAPSVLRCASDVVSGGACASEFCCLSEASASPLRSLT